MPKYTIHRNPFDANDFQTIEADRYEEAEGYTRFYSGDAEVLAVPTGLITNIVIEA